MASIKTAFIADDSGFTLVELVAIIILLGILSAAALPKFFKLSDYQQRALFDDTLSALRYAQKLAVSTGCNVRFTVTGNQFQLKRPGASDRSQCASTTSSDFSQSVPRPGSGESNYQGSQSGVTISDATLYFYAKGTASADTTVTIGGRSIAVVKETGFVYDSTP